MTALLLALPVLGLLVETLAFGVGRPALVALAEQWVGPICHHRPERTLHLGEHALPVCARCTGLYAGLAIGGGLGVLTGRRGRALGWLAGAGVIATVGGALAGLVEFLDLLHTHNLLRLGLGALLGVGPTFLAGLGTRVCFDEGRRLATRTG